MSATTSRGFGRENALLFAAVRVQPPESPIAATALDWPYLFDAAVRQGIAPLLHAWLLSHPAAGVPASWADRLKLEYWSTHFTNRLLLSELARISEAAVRADLPFIPLKGAVLSTEFYPAPALRPMSDLDLLVRAEDLDRMGQLLHTLEYFTVEASPSYSGDQDLDAASREHVWVAYRSHEWVMVEYRAEAMQSAMARLSDLDPSLADVSRAAAGDIWTRARRGSNGLRMSTEDLLLHVTAHLAAQHSDFRLIWLHDIARIVARDPRLDWEYIAATADRLRIAGPVAAAFDAVRRWLDAPIPDAVVADLARRSQPSGWLRRWELSRLSAHAATLIDADFRRATPAIWPFGAAISRMHGWGPRMRAIRWALLPSRAYLRLYGEAPRGPLGYVRAWSRRVLGGITRRATRAGGKRA